MLKTSLTTLLTGSLLAVSSFSLAANLVVGEKIPPFNVADKGECVLKADDTDFIPWSTDALKGSVQVVEYVAARAGIDDIDRAFFTALEQANFTAGQIAITKLVNSDDAMWGTSGLVAGEIRKNKKKEPSVRLVVDAEGVGQQQWELTKKNAALAILDANGKVLFFKEGGPDAEEIQQMIELIKQQLKPATPGNLSVSSLTQ